MVFFTSILIVTILYFFQADGMLYITVIALIAELANIFLTHTVAKSVEKKLTVRHRRSVQGYIKRIKASTKTIKDLEKVQSDAGTKLYKANSKIKELESQLKELSKGTVAPSTSVEPPLPNKKEEKATQPDPEPPEYHQNHLPAGSNRKAPPE